MNFFEVADFLEANGGEQYNKFKIKSSEAQKKLKELGDFLTDRTGFIKNSIRVFNASRNPKLLDYFWIKLYLDKTHLHDPFMIAVFFNKGYRVKINIERNQLNLKKYYGINSDKDEDYQKELNNRVAKKLNIENPILSFDINSSMSDEQIINNIYSRVNKLIPIYKFLLTKSPISGSLDLIENTKKNECIVIKDIEESELNDKKIDFLSSSTIDDISFSKPKKKKGLNSVVSAYEKARQEIKKSRKGKKGEEIVKSYLEGLINAKQIKSFEWVSGNSDTCRGNDCLGYDFTFIDLEGKTNFVEVKTSSYSSNREIYISANEYEVMQEKKDFYWIYLVIETEQKVTLKKMKGLKIMENIIPSEYKTILHLNNNFER